MMGLEAAESSLLEFPEVGEWCGRRTGSRDISCLSVFIKTWTERFSLSLSACLLPYFVFLPLTAVLSCCGSGPGLSPVLPWGSPRAGGSPWKCHGLAWLQTATSVLTFQGFDFQPGWQQWGLNYPNYLLGVKALCTGHCAGSSCDVWPQDNFALVPVLRSQIRCIWICL